MKRLWKRYKLLILTLLVLTLFVGSTYAYLVATDSQIINTFTFAQIDTGIDESIEASKKEVVITNTGKSSVYVRARVLVSGADVGVPAGSIVFKEGVPTEGTQAPPGNEIHVYYNNSEQWVEDGDWYYYNGVLAKGESTPPLIYAVYVGTGVKVPDGSSFEVDVYEESVLTSADSFNIGAAKAAFGS